MRHTDVSLDNCLKCSDCNSVCPVMTAHPAYPGPKHLGPELERFRREGLPCDNDWLEYCLGCERCDLACPNQVNVAELISQAKARHKKPMIRAIRDFWLGRPALLGKMLSLLPEVTNPLLAWKPVRWAMSVGGQIAAERPFPAYARPSVKTVAGQGPDRLLFFLGCSMRYNEQGLARTSMALLSHNGIETAIANGGCCGYPALANGDQDEARRRVRANLDEMVAAVDQGMSIVTACTTCGQMLKTGFTSLLGDDPALADKAKKVEAAVYDLGEYLMARSEAGLLKTDFTPSSHGLLAYHSPCHQATQGLARPWYHLLRLVPGMEIEDMNAGCCGMAGTFGFKQEKYPVSMAIGQRLFEAIGRADPELAVSECPTCRMQISHGAKVAAVHPAELLWEAYGLANDKLR